MKRVTRCPTCRAALDRARVVDENWMPGEAESHWHTRYACAGCLSVVEVVRPEADTRGHAPDVSVDVVASGAHVARLLARLREAQDPATLRAEATALLETDDRWLARVPEVFSAMRAVFRGEVRLARSAWFLSSDPMSPRLVPPVGRIHLREFSASKVEGIEGAERFYARVQAVEAEEGAPMVGGSFLAGTLGHVVIPRGTVFSVLELECPLVLAPAALAARGVPVSLAAIDSYVAAPDLLAPAGESP